jgi:hypothetical protein
MTASFAARARRFVVLAAGLSALVAGPAMAEDRRVKIINETDHTIVQFYASNVGQNDWEEDILGSDMLRPGQAVTVNIDDGSGYCKYDFKAVFSDGDVLIRHNIDVCQVSVYRYTGD